MLRISEVECWDNSVKQELIRLNVKDITPPRNKFLYVAQHWPLDDMTTDGRPEVLSTLLKAELDPENPGFLLRLCFSVYRLFELMMIDISEPSEVVREQYEGSRGFSGLNLGELIHYRAFLDELNARLQLRDADG
jgi:hypothetical protein